MSEFKKKEPALLAQSYTIEELLAYIVHYTECMEAVSSKEMHLAKPIKYCALKVWDLLPDENGETEKNN